MPMWLLECVLAMFGQERVVTSNRDECFSLHNWNLGRVKGVVGDPLEIQAPACSVSDKGPDLRLNYLFSVLTKPA